MRIRTGLAIMATVAAGLTVGVTASPAAAQVACTRVYTTPVLAGGQVSIEGFLACPNPEDPRDGAPLGVRLQRQTLTGWETVAIGTGDAVYNCTGIHSRTYRSAQQPSPVVVLNCS